MGEWFNGGLFDFWFCVFFKIGNLFNYFCFFLKMGFIIVYFIKCVYYFSLCYYYYYFFFGEGSDFINVDFL